MNPAKSPKASLVQTYTPPSSGWREDSAIVQIPSGRAIAKKPMIQTAIAEAPPAAAVATHCRFVPAVMMKKRTSRNPMPRWSPAGCDPLSRRRLVDGSAMAKRLSQERSGPDR